MAGEYIRAWRKYSPLRDSTRPHAQADHLDLTRRESQIMEILYRRRRATVEEIRAELPDAPSPSSVRKLLEIMIERGLLAREYDGPRYVYFPAAKPEDASRSALKQLVRTFFDNSPGSAMAALLDMTATPLSADEYRRLSGLLKRDAANRETSDEYVLCRSRRIHRSLDRPQGLGAPGRCRHRAGCRCTGERRPRRATWCGRSPCRACCCFR